MPKCIICGNTLTREGSPWKPVYRCNNKKPNGNHDTEMLCYCPVIEAPIMGDGVDWARVKLGVIPLGFKSPYIERIDRFLELMGKKLLEGVTYDNLFRICPFTVNR